MSLVPLRVDFALNRGHELIVDRETGITRAELDEVELHMLQGHPIPKLLQVEWIDIDGNIQFHYPLSGRRMLSHRLQMQSVTMTEYYALLLAVVEALDDCKHYMLREDGLLLQDQTVFVSERLDDIALCYVPLRDTSHSDSPADAVLALAIRWIGYVGQPDGNGMQVVFRHLREERISWSSLRQTLLRLLSEPMNAGIERAPVQEAAPASWHKARSEELERQQTSQDRNEYGNKARNESQSHQSSLFLPNEDNHNLAREKDALPLIELDTVDEEKPAARQQLITAAVFVIVVALIWRYLYLAEPSRTSLLISGGLTLLAAAGAIAYWGRKLRSESQDKRDSGSDMQSSLFEEDGFVPNSDVLNSKSMAAREEVSRRFFEARPDQEAGESFDNSRFAPFAPPGQLPNSSGGSVPNVNSSSLSTFKPIEQNQATVLLGQPGIADNGSLPDEPWLEREMNGHLERVALESGRFIIGRSPEGAQHVDTSSGISRAHLELTAEDELWTAKDMGSRNGTTLNGQTMVPYKSYRVASGDVLQLAGEKGPKYAFRGGKG
ncbi:DUF6382 domain-containing protein [Paenibacillus mendelii]|uniref:DUF6382 domain-containing protein n=1 Tax=Paenibacillus mendelii TaxID=206163 RepID=A0ABV6JJT8_9BACL|nr:DUF6382 domain-containing protein [Paenibacillus mendelii]MCQ6559120.1 FHA domain-containing protein [Paenibacillus mendelii]